MSGDDLKVEENKNSNRTVKLRKFFHKYKTFVLFLRTSKFWQLFTFFAKIFENKRALLEVSHTQK